MAAAVRRATVAAMEIEGAVAKGATEAARLATTVVMMIAEAVEIVVMAVTDATAVADPAMTAAAMTGATATNLVSVMLRPVHARMRGPERLGLWGAVHEAAAIRKTPDVSARFSVDQLCVGSSGPC